MSRTPNSDPPTLQLEPPDHWAAPDTSLEQMFTFDLSASRGMMQPRPNLRGVTLTRLV
jgi:hypothetical protein